MIEEKRRFPRFVADYPLVIAGDGIVAQGKLMDLSRGGCAIRSEVTAICGLYLEARILLPDNPAPLKIDLAPIRWMAPGQLGIEFIKLSAEDSARLDRYLASLAQ